MKLMQLIFRLISALPDKILIRMAGGPPPKIDGRVLDLNMHLIASQGANRPPLAQTTPRQMRKMSRLAFKLTNAPREKNVRVRDDHISINHDTVLPVRHYRPKKTSGNIPAILYLHMGGWVIGDLDSCDQFCSLLAQHIGAHVMSLDYRLAPEHKFPVALEDSFAAYLWLRDNASKLEIDLNHIAVAGDSAGGCMSAVLCQEMQRRGQPQPQAQLLIYPATDCTAAHGSMISCGDCQPLTSEMMDWFSQHWFNDESERKNPLASPIFGQISPDLASAVIVTAGFDPLRDQGAAYADLLKQEGVKVRYLCMNNLCHAFIAYAGLVPQAAKANKTIADELKMIMDV